MTGFARTRVSSPLGEIHIEARSVNHRYLEVSLRQPEELRSCDNAVRQKVQRALGRGKVEVNMRLLGDIDSERALQINDSALHQLSMALEHIGERLPQLGRVDALSLLRWPGVLRNEEVDEEQLSAAVLAGVDEVVTKLQASRADEGARLRAILEERLEQIESCIVAVRERLPEQNRKWREKLMERLAEMGEMEPERRDQALVQFAQRADVDEEIERLGSHITEVRAALEKGSPIGRKLDFYMQEFNREANTLGSKAMDAEITRLAVELKVLIEQMREQVQNIE